MDEPFSGSTSPRGSAWRPSCWRSGKAAPLRTRVPGHSRARSRANARLKAPAPEHRRASLQASPDRKTVLFVTHDLEEAIRARRRVVSSRRPGGHSCTPSSALDRPRDLLELRTAPRHRHVSRDLGGAPEEVIKSQRADGGGAWLRENATPARSSLAGRRGLTALALWQTLVMVNVLDSLLRQPPSAIMERIWQWIVGGSLWRHSPSRSKNRCWACSWRGARHLARLSLGGRRFSRACSIRTSRCSTPCRASSCAAVSVVVRARHLVKVALSARSCSS